MRYFYYDKHAKIFLPVLKVLIYTDIVINLVLTWIFLNLKNLIICICVEMIIIFLD